MLAVADADARIFTVCNDVAGAGAGAGADVAGASAGAGAGAGADANDWTVFMLIDSCS